MIKIRKFIIAKEGREIILQNFGTKVEIVSKVFNKRLRDSSDLELKLKIRARLGIEFKRGEESWVERPESFALRINLY